MSTRQLLEEVERLREIVRRARETREKIVVEKNVVVVLHDNLAYVYSMRSEDRARKLAKLFSFAEYFPLERILEVVEEYVRHLELEQSFAFTDDEAGWYHVELRESTRGEKRIVRTARSRNILVVDVEEEGCLEHVTIFVMKDENRAKKLHEFAETAFELFYAAPWFIVWLLDYEEHFVEEKGVVFSFVHEK